MSQCTKTYTRPNGSSTAHPITVQCPRPEYKDGLCILHYDCSDKPVGEFTNALKSIYKDTNSSCDFTEIVFPKADFTLNLRHQRGVYLSDCEVWGNLELDFTAIHEFAFFAGSTFHGSFTIKSDANREPHFNGAVDFRDCTFKKTARLSEITFQGIPQMDGTTFEGECLLNEIAFGGGWNSSSPIHLKFDEITFRDEARLSFTKDTRIDSIAFINSDLSGLVISDIMQDEYPIAFHGQTTWKTVRSSKFGIRRRRGLQDELCIDVPSVNAVHAYKRLENYFYERSDYNLSSDFYLGAMVAHRREPGTGRVERIISWLYDHLASFGNSISRPLVAFPTVFMCIGLTDGSREYTITTDWEEVASFTQIREDYYTAMKASINLSAFDRTNKASPSITSIRKAVLTGETILNIILVSLIVVAARRRFTPKKPLGV